MRQVTHSYDTLIENIEETILWICTLRESNNKLDHKESGDADMHRVNSIKCALSCFAQLGEIFGQVRYSKLLQEICAPRVDYTAALIVDV
jgi:hypothetical protein